MVNDVNRSQPSSLPDLGPDVMGLLALCTADLIRQRQELVLVLHQRLLELAPSVVRMPSSGRPMCRRLVDAVLHASGAGTRTPPPDAAIVVRRVGVDNHGEGFAVQEYGAVTRAVLDVVRGACSGAWTSALDSAWASFLLWFRHELLAAVGAQQAFAAPTAARPGALLSDLAWEPAPTSPRHASHSRDGDELSLPRSAILDDDLDDDLDDEGAPGYASLMSSMTLDSRRDRRAR